MELTTRESRRREEQALERLELWLIGSLVVFVAMTVVTLTFDGINLYALLIS